MNMHLSRQYDSDLDDVRTRVLQMGGLVELQMTNAIQALACGDRELIGRVLDTEPQVDLFETDIDELCARIIARRQPTASDLRLLLGISKAVTDLERIGDKARKIVRLTRLLLERNVTNLPCLNEVRQCGQQALGMLHQALDALARIDRDSAEAVIEADDAIDEAFRGITRQLITYMMEDPRTISTSLDILSVIKAIERVGDHATNIAEQVIYIAQGTDVRHLHDHDHEE